MKKAPSTNHWQNEAPSWIGCSASATNDMKSNILSLLSSIFFTYVGLFALSIHSLDFLNHQFKVVTQFLHLAVHLVDEAVALL